MDIRLGNGFDVHRFAPERELWLCGVKIPYELGLLGHSDADVAIHALCDALLGAVALRDIGYDGWATGEMIPAYGHASDQIIYNTVASMGRILEKKF